MIALLLIALAILIVLVVALVRSRRAQAATGAALADVQSRLWQAQRSEQVALERMHAIGDSALRGCPAVKWQRPQPIPAGADAYYWRVRIAGEDLLLTDEQFRAARQRADHLLHPVATH